MKQCVGCKETKPFLDFYEQKGKSDGHSSRCKACRKEWRRANYLKNKDKQLAQCKQWRENNRALRKHYKEQRLEAEANRTPSWANMERMNGIYKLAKYLSRKYGRDIHVDHEIPLRGALVSGLHVEDNLQLMYAEDNLSKSNRYEVN